MASEGFHSRPIAGAPADVPRTPVSGDGTVPPAAPRPRAPRGRPPMRRGNRVTRAVRWVIEERRRLGWKAFLLRGAGAVALTGVLYIGFLWLTLPNLDDPGIIFAAQSTSITDRNGVELYRLYSEEDRTYVPGTQIADSVKNAVVAIEDERFFDRGCLDVRALARVFLRFGQAGGASTLTRQLARNALDLQHDNIVNRKLKEIILGCQLESKFEKEKILELYLNWVPFGNNAYGVEQASRRYFSKPAKDLTVAQSAVLASLPQLPSYYSPYGRHVRTQVTDRVLEDIATGRVTSLTQIQDDDVTIGLIGANAGTGANAIYVGGRTDQVLRNMQDQGMITEDERMAALSELQSLVFTPSKRESFGAAHFVLWTRDLVEKAFAGTADKGILEQGGLTVQTTLDIRLQKAAEEIVRKRAESTAEIYGAHNIALVAMDPRTKEILAYVGNTDYGDEEHEGKVDMALVPRQPGSSFKPFVYAGAFLEGYSPATVLHDVSTRFGDYQPQNFEGGFWGLSTIRKSLGGSRNIPAIKAYFLAGEEDKLLDMVEGMGLPTPKVQKPDAGYGPSMAIGTAETPLLEMVQGYATLADGGIYKPYQSISRITDRRGSLLPLPGSLDPQAEGTEAIDPRVAYLVTSILSDPSVRPGDYWRTILTVPGTQAAAKTGTSNKCLKRDAKQNCTDRKPDNVWTMGYTPNLVVGVWVGNATAEPLSPSADGINVAAPIWKDFMVAALAIMDPEVTSFTQPDGLVQVQASLLSGELPTECTPVEFRKSDLFLKEYAPKRQDPACVTLEVDKVTGLLASQSCPAEARETKSFYQPYTPFAQRFPSWEQGVRTWATTGSGSPLPLAPTEQCDISKTPGRLTKPTVSILTPSGSATYPSFPLKIRFTTGSSRPREARVEIDGKPAGTFISGTFDGPVRVPRSIGKGGSHTVTVTLVDEYYNQASDSVTVSFEGDASGPDVSLTSPEDGETFAKDTPVAVLADAGDSEGDLKYVEFYLNDVLLTRKPRAPFGFSYPVETAGTHLIRAVATDLAGNTSEDFVTITVTEGTGSGETVLP